MRACTIARLHQCAPAAARSPGSWAGPPSPAGQSAGWGSSALIRCEAAICELPGCILGHRCVKPGAAARKSPSHAQCTVLCVENRWLGAARGDAPATAQATVVVAPPFHQPPRCA